MKIKGKQNIEYWLTTGKYGAMIRVYRIDPLQEVEMQPSAFQVPILVEHRGQGESIADILEERDRLRIEVAQKGSSLSSYWIDRVEEIDRKLKLRKKWYQFWK